MDRGFRALNEIFVIWLAFEADLRKWKSFMGMLVVVS